MESDPTLGAESPKILLTKEAIQILSQAMHKIDENDLFSAQVMVGVALQYLENLQVDITTHLSLEKRLRDTLKSS